MQKEIDLYYREAQQLLTHLRPLARRMQISALLLCYYFDQTKNKYEWKNLFYFDVIFAKKAQNPRLRRDFGFRILYQSCGNAQEIDVAIIKAFPRNTNYAKPNRHLSLGSIP